MNQSIVEEVAAMLAREGAGRDCGKHHAARCERLARAALSAPRVTLALKLLALVDSPARMIDVFSQWFTFHPAKIESDARMIRTRMLRAAGEINA